MFVKLDRYPGAQLSTDVDKHKIVPFTECVDEIRLTVNEHTTCAGNFHSFWLIVLQLINLKV